MGTQYLVKLVREEDCYECEGKGNKGETEFSDPNDPTKTIKRKIDCLKCNNTGKLWYRMHYTHAHTYEQAMKKLLSRLSQHGFTSLDFKYYLVWDKKANTGPIDITLAVNKRIQKILEKRLKKSNKYDKYSLNDRLTNDRNIANALGTGR